MNWAEQIALNVQHSLHPEPGDYWEDHFVGVLQVIATAHGMVIFLDKKIEESYGWNWDQSKPRALSLAEFRTFLQYKSPNMDGRTWACVHPNRKINNDETQEA